MAAAPMSASAAVAAKRAGIPVEDDFCCCPDTLIALRWRSGVVGGV